MPPSPADPHLLPSAVVSVPSRFANTICAPVVSSLLTGSRYVVGLGGRSGELPRLMSPTAAIVTGAVEDGLALAECGAAGELAVAGVRPEVAGCATD